MTFWRFGNCIVLADFDLFGCTGTGSWEDTFLRSRCAHCCFRRNWKQKQSSANTCELDMCHDVPMFCFFVGVGFSYATIDIICRYTYIFFLRTLAAPFTTFIHTSHKDTYLRRCKYDINGTSVLQWHWYVLNGWCHWSHQRRVSSVDDTHVTLSFCR